MEKSRQSIRILARYEMTWKSFQALPERQRKIVVSLMLLM